MTISSALTSIIQSFGVISILLLIGAFLRAKIPLFQKLYLPACVIGGFLGLLVGPNAFNVIKFSEETMALASALPSVFIVPVLAATPMCLKLKGTGSSLKKGNDITVLAFMECGFFVFQMAIGCAVTAICVLLGAKAYHGMGLEMGFGFSGGHGTAASMGSILQNLGDPMWEVAQGGAMTTATVGLICGIIIGIIMINVAARKGYTTQIKSVAETPKEMRVGIYPKQEDLRPSCGPQTTVSNNIETLALHMALLLVGSLGGYMFSSLASRSGITFLTYFPTFVYAMVAMGILWFIITKLKIDYLFDETVKNKLTGLLSDYMICAAIMSIPVTAVATYWVVLLATMVVGGILTAWFNQYICKRFLRTNWFEKSMGMLGANFGVFITGVLLLKMADPELKSDALSDYSVGYAIGSLPAAIIMTLAVERVSHGGTMAAFIFTGAIALAVFSALFIVEATIFKKK